MRKNSWLILSSFFTGVFLLSSCSFTSVKVNPQITTQSANKSLQVPLKENGLKLITPQSIVKTKWDLWSSGSTLLRGANIYQRLVVPEVDGFDSLGAGHVGPPFYQTDFDQLKESGANYVVLSVPGLFTEKPPFQVDQIVQQNLDAMIQMAAQADLFVTIAFRTGPGRSEWSMCCKDMLDLKFLFNDQVWTSTSDQQGWIDMWKYTAERYKNSPNVVGYELMVEPDGEDIWLNISDPQDFYPSYKGSLFDWNVFYPKIVTAIRMVDDKTPIIVGGMGYSSIAWLPYLQPNSDQKIIYDVHQYEPMGAYTHQTPNGKNKYSGTMDINSDGNLELVDQTWLRTKLNVIKDFVNANHAPVSINEFGIKRWVPGAEAFMKDEMTIFEENGWNYSMWEWSTSNSPFAREINDFNFRLGTDPRNTTEEVANDLWNTIKYFWQRNQVRPSTIQW